MFLPNFFLFMFVPTSIVQSTIATLESNIIKQKTELEENFEKSIFEARENEKEKLNSTITDLRQRYFFFFTFYHMFFAFLLFFLIFILFIFYTKDLHKSFYISNGIFLFWISTILNFNFEDFIFFLLSVFSFCFFIFLSFFYNFSFVFRVQIFLSTRIELESRCQGYVQEIKVRTQSFPTPLI